MLRFVILIAALLLSLHAAPSLKLDTYNTMTKAQELIDAKAYDDALKLLDDYAPNIEETPYDRAYLNTYYGYLYVAQEDYPRALEAYKEAYEAKVLSEEMQQNLLYNLAQLYISSEAYRKGIDALKAWMNAAKEIGVNDYIMIAQAYIQLSEYATALPYIEKAISLAKTPDENHYQMLFYLQFELKRLDDAITTLHTMIARFEPNKLYWLQLSGLYAQQERDKKALAALDSAYRAGLLNHSDEFLQLVSMFLAEQIPFKAAQILQTQIENETVAANFQHYKLLGDAWLQAREYTQAISAYQEAARRSDEGGIYLNIARLHVDAQQYDDAIAMCDKALQKKLPSKGEAYYLKGLSLFELERMIDAKTAFTKAQSDPHYEERAKEWIKFLLHVKEKTS